MVKIKTKREGVQRAGRTVIVEPVNMTLDMSGQLDQALVLLGALDGETADEGVDRSAHSEREPFEIRKVDILRIKTEETNLRTLSGGKRIGNKNTTYCGINQFFHCNPRNWGIQEVKRVEEAEGLTRLMNLLDVLVGCGKRR
jgi:hypothetical protein